VGEGDHATAAQIGELMYGIVALWPFALDFSAKLATAFGRVCTMVKGARRLAAWSSTWRKDVAYNS
jgi:hypothetical protein